MRRATVAGLIVSLGLAWGAYGQAPNKLKEVLPHLVEARKAASRTNVKVWPGFQYDQYSAVVWDKETGTALLTQIDQAPPGFRPLDKSHSDILWGKLPADALLTEDTRQFGEKLAAWISADSVLARPGDEVRLLYERAFSVFAFYRGLTVPDPSIQASYPYVDAENNAIVRAENALLAHMLTLDARSMKPYLKAFASLRERRISRMEPTIRDFEGSTEVFRGLQHYCGFQVYGIDRERAIGQLAEKLRSLNGEGEKEVLVRLRWTGCALALLLDKTGGDWKAFVEAESRDSFLKAAQKMADPSVRPASIDFLDLPTLLAEEREKSGAVMAERQVLIDRIEGADGIVIVIDLTTALAQKVQWDQRAEPGGKLTLTSARSIYTKYYALKGTGLLDLKSSRPILIETRKSITAGFNLDEYPYVLVDGSRPTFSDRVEPVIGTLEIKGPQFQLKAPWARVDLKNKRLSVEILPMPAHRPRPRPAPRPIPEGEVQTEPPAAAPENPETSAEDS